MTVVAYDVETYRPIFQNLVRYVPCFDLLAFQEEAAAQVSKMRAGENYLTGLSLQEFRRAHSWQTAQKQTRDKSVKPPDPRIRRRPCDVLMNAP